jgi:hypothetical protein
MLKNVVALAAALVCGVASAVTPITLVQDPDDSTQWSASFSGNASGDNVFTIDLSAFAGYTYIDLEPLLVTANFSGRQGYDVTGVSFNGTALDSDLGFSIPGFAGVDAWAYAELDLTPAVHTIVVTGNLLGGTAGFTGSLNIYAQPVPEPESYALMLAGLAAVGAIVRRRRSH